MIFKVGVNMKNNFDFYDMENNFLEVSDEIREISASLESFEKNLPNIQLFLQYYGSDEWFKHREMDEKGLLSNSATTSVLGEDYSYDLVMDIKYLANKMKDISNSLLEE